MYNCQDCYAQCRLLDLVVQFNFGKKGKACVNFDFVVRNVEIGCSDFKKTKGLVEVRAFKEKVLCRDGVGIAELSHRFRG